MSLIKVSVIIPVYNAEEYIHQCLDSVINQTLKDIEIICVDDGSNDNSLKILQEYAAADSRLKVLTQKNQYAGAARNAGIEIARGDYYVFLDSDDFFEPDLLELEFNQVQKENADICLCGADKYDTGAKKIMPAPYWLNRELLKDKKPCNKETLGNQLFRITPSAPWTKMFRADFVKKHKLRFQAIPRANDVYFVLSALCLASHITFVDKVLVHYRVGNASSLQATNLKSPTVFLEALEGVAERVEFFKASSALQQAFSNVAMEHMAYNLRTLEKAGDNALLLKLKLLLRKKYTRKFFIDQKSREYFFNQNDYSFLVKQGVLEDLESKIKLSLIVPIYNVEDYLEECLESMVNQTLKEIEIICVDDASPDNSIEIAEKFSKHDSRVRIVRHKENKGLGGARNTGLDIAVGKYTWFVDSDDYLDLDAAEKLYNKMEELGDVDILGFNADAFKETAEGRVPCPRRAITHNWPDCVKISLPDQADTMPDTIEGSAAVYIAKKSFINNFRFRERVYFEDADFSFKVFTSMANFYFMNSYSPYHRRVTETSITGRNADGEEKPQTTISRIVAARAIMDVVNEKELGDKNYAVIWFKRWAKYVIGLYLARPNIYEESVNVYVRELQYRFNLYTEKDMLSQCAVFMKPEALPPKRTQEAVNESKRSQNTFEEAKYKSLYETYRHELELTQKSASFRIGRFITWLPRKVRGGIRCYHEHGMAYTFQRVIVHLGLKSDPFEVVATPQKLPVKPENKKEPLALGCSTIKHSPEFIVSLTSFPARISMVHKTIETILRQTERPDRIILWLGEEQFPKKEMELPKELLNLKKFGVSIKWCKDIRSYKKLIPTLKLYPEAIIVTADDDVYYHEDWLKALYSSYLKWPANIHCHRNTKFYLENGEFKWVPGGNLSYPCPTYLHKLVGIGGVLYPPHSLYSDVLKEELFFTLARTNDDLWFWFMAILNNYKILVVENNVPQPKYVEGTQDGECLTKINDQGLNLFLQDLNNLFNYYPEVKRKLFAENDFVRNYEACAKLPSREKNYDYYASVPHDQLDAVLAEWFHRFTGEWLNLDAPKTYNEKIQWMKLYDSIPLKTILADKYLVRDWIKEKIGEEYLIPLIGVWDNFDDIDFDKLPNQFVLKANHGSGWNIVVKDKTKFDLKDARRKFNVWMNENFAFVGLEFHYMNIPPRIIVEEYLENDNNDLYDYKVFCFNGKAESIMFLSERQQGLKMAFYDLNWNKLQFVYSYPQNPSDVPRPKNLELLINLSEKLAAGFAHVRVDFYILNDGSLKFGELTFSSANGKCKWNPSEQNRIYGDMIKLPLQSSIPERKF